MKGVQEPSRDNGGIGSRDNSLGSDLYCGNENTGYREWPVVSGIGWGVFEWGLRQFGAQCQFAGNRHCEVGHFLEKIPSREREWERERTVERRFEMLGTRKGIPDKKRCERRAMW